MTWSSTAIRALAVLLGAALLVVGYWWIQGRSRPVATAPDAAAAVAPASLGEVTVHVRGRVRDPGVVTLAAGSRVIDAIEASGGLRPGASSGDLNLARVLVDGEQVAVGLRQPAPAGQSAVGAGDSGAGDPGGGSALLDLNAASATELEALPGIGPVLAERIVSWRTENGPFPAVDVLGEVSGIGDALLQQLRDLVRV